MSDLRVIEYEPQGVCSRFMRVKIDENDIIADVEIIGGCNGNLKGIKSLITGMNINSVIEKLKGISCNGKPTSCPDQLATCLLLYKEEYAKENAIV